MRNIEHDTRNAIGEMRNIERDTRNAIREILKAIREILKAKRETRYAKCEILNAICEMRWAKCDTRMSPRGLHKSHYVSLWYTQFRKMRASKGGDLLLCNDTNFELHPVILNTSHLQLPFYSMLVTRRPYLGHDK